MFALLETQQELTAADVRALHPETSFPPEFGPECLGPLGIVEVEFDPVPELQDGETLEGGALRRDGERIVRDWVVIPAPLPDWPAAIAERRYQSEIAGITINGMPVETDDRAKLLINGAALEAVIDPGYVMQWKAGEGFVELSGAQVIGIARAVRAHVQACFDRESELLAELEAGTLTGEMLEQGWPVA